MTVETPGSWPAARSDDVALTVSLASLEISPIAPANGKVMPATITPATRQIARSFVIGRTLAPMFRSPLATTVRVRGGV